MATLRYATIRLVERAGPGQMEPTEWSSSFLRPALQSPAAVERYRHLWRLGDVQELRPGVISGRVGYDDDRSATFYDEERQGFVDESVPNGAAFPFVVDLATGRMAYQAPTSRGVLSAIQALINAGGSGTWRVSAILVEQSWEEWRRRVSRVQRLSFRLRLPNPNFRGRERLEQMMVSSRAGLLRTVYEADPDDLEGLDLEAEYIGQMRQHADMGYGNYRAVGTQQTEAGEVEERFDSTPGGAERVDQVDVDDGQSIPLGVMVERLATVPADAPTEAADDVDSI